MNNIIEKNNAIKVKMSISCFNTRFHIITEYLNKIDSKAAAGVTYHSVSLECMGLFWIMDHVHVYVDPMQPCKGIESAGSDWSIKKDYK